MAEIRRTEPLRNFPINLIQDLNYDQFVPNVGGQRRTSRRKIANIRSNAINFLASWEHLQQDIRS